MPPLLGCGSGRPFPSLVFLAMEVELPMEWVRGKYVKNCKCTEEDFQCDVGFKRSVVDG